MINRVKEKLFDNFTLLPNELFNGELSAKAVGIFAYLCSKDEDWVFYQKEIENHFNMGASAVASGLKELEEAGLLLRYRMRDDKGRLGKNIYILYPTERDFKEAEPYIGKSHLGKKYIGKSNTINKDNNNKEDNNKDNSSFIEEQDFQFFWDWLKEVAPMSLSKKNKFEIVFMQLRTHYKLEEIKEVIEWAMSNDFWNDKLLNDYSLKNNFEKMMLQMKKQVNNAPTVNSKGKKQPATIIDPEWGEVAVSGFNWNENDFKF